MRCWLSLARNAGCRLYQPKGASAHLLQMIFDIFDQCFLSICSSGFQIASCTKTGAASAFYPCKIIEQYFQP